MKSMRKLFAGLAATATLLGGMAIGATANAAESNYIPASDSDSYNTVLKVTSTEDTASAVSGHTFKAVRIGKYLGGTAADSCTDLASCYALKNIDVATPTDTAGGKNIATILDAVLKTVDEDADKDGVQNGYIGSSYETDKNPAGYIAVNYKGYGTDSKDTTSNTAPAYAGLLRDFVTKLTANADFQAFLAAANTGQNVYTATGADGVADFVKGTKPWTAVNSGIYMIIDVTEGQDSHALPMVVGSKMLDAWGKLVALENEDSMSGLAVVKTVPDVSQKKTVVGDDSAYIGGTVKFQLEGTIPLQPVNNDYYFRDAYGSGLKVTLPTASNANGFEVRVAGVEEPLAYGTGYTISNVQDQSDKSEGISWFELHITNPAQYAGKKVTVTYEATVTDRILYTSNGAAKPGTGCFEMYNRLVAVDESYQTDSTVHVYTYSFEFNKFDADDNPVNGAEFVVKNDEGKYLAGGPVRGWSLVGDKADAWTEESNGDDYGKVRFDGLKAGTYTVEEVKTADGFADIKPSFTVRLGDPSGNDASPSYVPLFDVTETQDPFGLVEVTTNSNGDKTGVNVTNIKSVITELPLTGGVGIVIFTVTATALLGVALFGVSRYRSSRRSLRV